MSITFHLTIPEPTEAQERQLTFELEMLQALGGTEAVLDRLAREHGPRVDLNSGNAAEVLDLLGLAPGYGEGEIAAHDLVRRTLRALNHPAVVADDHHGQEAIESGRWVECGRRAGYLRDRLQALHALAIAARDRGERVWWA